ncbi:MAG TPA: hypothetical protein VKA84_14825 [Gemmatimonadaceae bacterium]|nr:hypothetical protein [Gemmatimonadaceae bacterium]
MTFSRITRRSASRAAAALGLLAAAGAAACDDGRTVVTQPFGPYSFNFRVVPDGRTIPKGTVTIAHTATDSSVTLLVQGIERLAGTAVYQVWLANADGTGLVKAQGTLQEFRVDTVFTSLGDLKPDTVPVGAAATASSFSAGGSSTLVVLRVDRASLGSNPLDKGLVLVTVEESAAAAQPGDSRPLWATYTPTIEPKALTFGRWDSNPANQYIFVPIGRGQISVRGDVLLAYDSSLSRPPVGYYYATYVIRRNKDEAVIDTVRIGELQAPDGTTSLRSADSSSVHPVVQAKSIVAGFNRVDARTATSGLNAGPTPYKDFADYLITLENKHGDEQKASPSVILRGVVPAPIRSPATE